MNKFKFKIKHIKTFFTILIILTLLLIIFFYHFVLAGYVNKNHYLNQMLQISDQSENDIFSIEKVSLHSSAIPIDNSEDHSLSNINVNQYTDILIYLNNSGSSNDLTSDNSVKSLYIDNIKIEKKENIGTSILNYKNANLFGKYQEIQKPENDRIMFNILSTNDENENNDYNNPVFFTDCSNPITLSLLHKDILTNYSVNNKNENKTISDNGKVLKETNFNINKLSTILSFTIHVVNNINQHFAYNLTLNIDLKDDQGSIYNGSFDRSKTTIGNEYKFMSEFAN